MKLAVVGATGMVGNVMLQVLAERKLAVDEYLFVASERSVGKEIQFNNKSYKVIGLDDAVNDQPDIAILSAGGNTSREWAPKFAAVGAIVIDNSSAWRMDKTKKLIVPVLALLPLHVHYGIKRLVISTYQSVSGTGVKAIEQMNNERTGKSGEMAYPYPIDMNCLPHGGDFQEDGYTTEEQKLVDETRKIFGEEDIAITATVVRVPVSGGHSEAINVELKKAFNLDEVTQLLSKTSGVKVQDNPDVNLYPMPLYAKGKDDVFVGRIRRDFSQPNTLNMWVVSDNLRKGAATNAVQIAAYVIGKGLALRVV